jgi:hypothetical protein
MKLPLWIPVRGRVPNLFVDAVRCLASPPAWLIRALQLHQRRKEMVTAIDDAITHLVGDRYP